MSYFKRNIPLLALNQAVMMSGTTLIVTTSALVGVSLASNKSLATLPMAALFIATFLTSIPAALLMRRIGRKPAFMLAAVFGACGGIISTLAIVQEAFWWFLIGVVCVGVFNGFGNYYRFAAADAALPSQKSRAISYIMTGGIIAAIVGPNLAYYTRELVAGATFAGSYATLIGLYLLAFCSLGFLRLPETSHGKQQADAEPERSLAVIVRQQKFIVALICGMCGYALMTLLMSATPLAMHEHNHPFSATSFVIQWHVLGMFAPSLITGRLIQRFGVLNIMLFGGGLALACIIINLIGTSLWHFWSALMLLGVSWNFLFIGATTLLTETYRPEERAKTQAANDFVVFTTVALASLSAGALQHQLGWQAVNLGVLPLLAFIFVSLLWIKRKQHLEVAQVYVP